MRVFAFDFPAYPVQLDDLEGDQVLPYPLSKRHFRPETAVRTYRENLEAWEFMDELGFDGITFAEQHTISACLTPSPNVMVAAVSQRTKNTKLLTYGNLLSLHEPLRLAEELAMLDCLTDGRLIAGIARGSARDHRVYGVDMSQSRARFEEAWKIIKLAWTEEVFSYQGKFWSYNNVAIWPRPVQQPHPPAWIPVTLSKESIEWAARENMVITPGLSTLVLSAKQDIVRYYAQCLDRHGHAITPDHLMLGVDVYVADSRQQAFKEAGPYMLEFLRAVASRGTTGNVSPRARRDYEIDEDINYLRPESLEALSRTVLRGRPVSLEDMERNGVTCWGSPEEVRDALIAQAEAVGTNTLMLHFNRGPMQHEMYMQNLRRFGEEVLPAIKAHEVRRVPVA